MPPRQKRCEGVYTPSRFARLSPDVLASFKAIGKGWQTRIDAILKEWLKEHAI
jgi:uncharacterized protein (DUF4415 family)